MESTPTIITIILAVAGLLGYVVKLTLPKALKTIDKKDDQIMGLITGFHDTTKKFVDLQNHKTTEMTTAIMKLTDAIDRSNILKK